MPKDCTFASENKTKTQYTMKLIINIETGHIYGHIDTTNDEIYYNTLAIVGLTEIESDSNNIYVLENNQL